MKTGRTIVNILKATMRGELLLSLKIDKIFMHIIYLFVVVWFTIYISLKIEQTLTRVERNSAVLEDLRIYHAQKTAPRRQHGPERPVIVLQSGQGDLRPGSSLQLFHVLASLHA